MIPARLDAWSLERVHDVAEAGIAENDLFDLKADLQPAEHTRKVVAAFANTRGGFLVFGVGNDRRVEGIKNPELPRDFGARLRSGIEPYPDYRFGPPMPLKDGRLIFVAEVPRSLWAPHAVFAGGSWVFLKRTAGGSNEPMGYEEIRLAFQDTEMRRTTLALVSSELEHIEAIADRLLANVPMPQDKHVHHWAWATRYPTALLDSVLGDAFSLLARHVETQRDLFYIRDAARTSNTLAEVLAGLTHSALRGFEQHMSGYQSQIRGHAEDLKGKCRSARVALQRVLEGAPE